MKFTGNLQAPRRFRSFRLAPFLQALPIRLLHGKGRQRRYVHISIKRYPCCTFKCLETELTTYCVGCTIPNV